MLAESLIGCTGEYSTPIFHVLDVINVLFARRGTFFPAAPLTVSRVWRRTTWIGHAGNLRRCPDAIIIIVVVVVVVVIVVVVIVVVVSVVDSRYQSDGVFDR